MRWNSVWLSRLSPLVTFQSSSDDCPPVIASAFAAIVGNLVQFGMLLAFEPIKPDIKKINPIQGAKKIFSIKNVVELFKSIIKILFLSSSSTS